MSLMQVSILSKTTTPHGTQLEGSKNPSPGTIIVYENPPLRTKQRFAMRKLIIITTGHS